MPTKIPFEDRSAGFAATSKELERRRFYNSLAWKSLRARQLLFEPLCQRCLAKSIVAEASVVHHVADRLLRPDLALSRGNLESLCASCHSEHHATRKRIKEQDQ
jgi:5-methylcytosine-specific restriction endonuclease McrA